MDESSGLVAGAGKGSAGPSHRELGLGRRSGRGGNWRGEGGGGVHLSLVQLLHVGPEIGGRGRHQFGLGNILGLLLNLLVGARTASAGEGPSEQQGGKGSFHGAEFRPRRRRWSGNYGFRSPLRLLPPSRRFCKWSTRIACSSRGAFYTEGCPNIKPLSSGNSAALSSRIKNIRAIIPGVLTAATP